MTWEDVKELIRKSGLKHSIFNKGGECETVHVERPDGPWTIDVQLYRYEPQYWQCNLQRVCIEMPRQLDLFA